MKEKLELLKRLSELERTAINLLLNDEEVLRKVLMTILEEKRRLLALSVLEETQTETEIERTEESTNTEPVWETETEQTEEEEEDVWET